MKLVLVYNPKSGSTDSSQRLRQACKQAGIEVEKLIEIGDGLESKLRPYIDKGEKIAAIGGDGTLNAVAGLIAGSKATFVPLCGGTFNHFVKDLGVPLELDKALSGLAQAKPQLIDVGEVNGKVFLNNAGLGLYPQSLNIRSSLEAEQTNKWLAAALAGLKTFFKFKTYKVSIDGQSFHSPFIFVGNNRYSADELGLLSRRKLDGAKLCVLVAKTRSRLSMIGIALLAVVGQASRHDEFQEFTAKQLTIAVHKKTVMVSFDGEFAKMDDPICFEIKPKALRVLYSRS